jgi:phosphatidylglycerophosphate synthase
MLAERKHKFKFLEDFLADVFTRTGLSANQFTLISIAFVFFISAGISDLIDGAVARRKGEASKKGAYLDTTVDRYIEAITLLGFLFIPLQTVFLPSAVWIFLALMGSLITTYSKAAAKEKELIFEELKTGFFGRTERIVSIGLAIFMGIFNFSLMIYPIIILAIFSNLTALQRIFLAVNSAQN